MKRPIQQMLIGILTVAAAGLMLAIPTAVSAQQKAGNVSKQLVGVWKLVSDVNTGTDGAVKSSFGPNPQGQYMFTSSGHYASINTRPDIAKFASGNRMQGTPEEYKAVVQGSVAHFGTYTVTPDGKVLMLKVEGSTWPAWAGTEQKRDFSIKGDELKVSVAASIGGTSVLVYKRVK